MEKTELYKRANANLVALANGDVKRATTAKRAAAKRVISWEAMERAAAKARKAEIAALRRQVVEWDAAEVDIRADSFYTDDGGQLQGALEEIDHERNKCLERIYKLECES